MTDPADLFNQALDHLDVGDFKSAVAKFEACLALVPGRASVRYNLATALFQLGEYSRAGEIVEGLLPKEPDNPDYLNLLASAIFPLGEYARAISIYERLRQRGFASWETNHNLLHALVSVGDLAKSESLVAEFKADGIPEQAYRLNLAILRLKQNRFDKALSLFDRILAENPADGEALFQRGRCRSLRQNIDGALNDFQALEKLGQPSARVGTYAYLVRLQAAHWEAFEADVEFLTAFNEKNAPKCHNPFVCLLLPRSLEFEHEVSKVATKFLSGKSDKEQMSIDAMPRHCNNERVHVGYMSANYRRHPSAHNITKLIEEHDRSRFKIIGFDLYGENNSAERTRLKDAFDEFIDLSQKSDEEAGDAIRNLGVDILIDQMGHTARSRSNLFAQRNAPVQISYLGYPGTSGMTSIDYVIGDDTIIRPGEEEYYTEAVCYMPDTYWPAEGAVTVGKPSVTRKDYGISEGTIAYCCFNIFQKITPPVFDRWMEIMANVANSCLALLDGPEIAKSNLRREAEKRGIAGDRLKFVPKVSPAEHLARQSLFDVFLDTSPYNAHTIGRDALLGGLPMITCIGDTFSDRVAASLLRAAGLEELISTNGKAFVDLGIQLGQDPRSLKQIKAKLINNIETQPLFDTPLFARNFELAFKEMNRRSLANEAHTSFHVSNIVRH